jgi:hypothetical protein
LQYILQYINPKLALVVGRRQLKIAVQHSIFNHFLTPTSGIFLKKTSTLNVKIL